MSYVTCGEDFDKDTVTVEVGITNDGQTYVDIAVEDFVVGAQLFGLSLPLSTWENLVEAVNNKLKEMGR